MAGDRLVQTPVHLYGVRTGFSALAEDSAGVDGCPAGSTITVPGYCISRFGVHANAPLDRISCRELEDRLRAEGNEDEHEYNLYGSDL